MALQVTTVLSALFIALGGFLFGFELGIVSSTLAQPHFIQYFENPSDAVVGGIVSCYTGKLAHTTTPLTAMSNFD
jgi:hypothetical protein